MDLSRLIPIRVALVGRGGSGKNFAQSALVNSGIFQPQLSYTTRPPRPTEKHGQDYFFVSKEEFEDRIAQGQWQEYQKFTSAGWYYGTLKSQFQVLPTERSKVKLFIMSPQGLSHLSEKDRSETLVVYLNIDDKKILTQRLKERGWSDEQVRVRMQADQEQFGKYKLTEPGLEITDPWFEPQALIQQIKIRM